MSATADEPGPLAYRRFDCTGEDPESYSAAIDAARQAVEAGDCVVLPTDTVYGIGVDAFSGDAGHHGHPAEVRHLDGVHVPVADPGHRPGAERQPAAQPAGQIGHRHRDGQHQEVLPQLGLLALAAAYGA